MSNFVNQSENRLNWVNSIWMFNAEFATYYGNRYDFVKFNESDEIEYLNWRGELLSKDSIVLIDGILKLKSDSNFKGFEFISRNELNLVIECEEVFDDKPNELKDNKFNIVRLAPTNIEINENEFVEICENSNWELIPQNGMGRKVVKLSTYEEMPISEIQEILNDSHRFINHKISNHLFKIGDSVILVKQRMNKIDSKIYISKLDNKQMTVFANGESLKLNRL